MRYKRPPEDQARLMNNDWNALHSAVHSIQGSRDGSSILVRMPCATVLILWNFDEISGGGSDQELKEGHAEA